MPLALGTILENRYRIDALLGSGGMGAVYRAWDRRLDRHVAIKEDALATPESARQFEREAKMLARLRHPNLPGVSDHFVAPNGAQYLVMDYVEGEDLGQMLQRLGPLDEARAVAWIEQVCDALVYLHSRQPPVIHRDVKPGNVKITPQGEVFLVDFGIAKVGDAQAKTTMGALGVTPGFSPPEQYGQGGTDARSDVYALGATLYALLTGQKPPDSVQRAIRAAVLAPPRTLRPDVSPAVASALEAALRTTPTDRPQTVAAFRAILRGEVPPPAPSRHEAPTVLTDEARRGGVEAAAPGFQRREVPAEPPPEPVPAQAEPAPAVEAKAEVAPAPPAPKQAVPAVERQILPREVKPREPVRAESRPAPPQPPTTWRNRLPKSLPWPAVGAAAVILVVVLLLLAQGGKQATVEPTAPMEVVVAQTTEVPKPEPTFTATAKPASTSRPTYTPSLTPKPMKTPVLTPVPSKTSVPTATPTPSPGVPSLPVKVTKRVTAAGTWSTFTDSHVVPQHWDFQMVYALAFHDGTLWMATYYGVKALDVERGTYFRFSERPASGRVQAVAVGQDGVLWFGTNSGVVRYDPEGDTWQVFSETDGLGNETVEAVAVEPEGVLWFGTRGGGVSRYDPTEGSWQTFTEEDGLADNLVRAVAVGLDGTLWFSTPEGLSHYDPHRDEWQTFTKRDGLASEDVWAIAMEADGILWFGTLGGVSRHDPVEKTWQTLKEADGLVDNNVDAVAVGTDGALWFGTSSDGVSRYDPKTGNWKTFREADGLAHNSVTAIAVEPGGALWFGSWGLGVTRFEPAE